LFFDKKQSGLLLLKKANDQSLEERKVLKRGRNLIKRVGVGEDLGLEI